MKVSYKKLWIMLAEHEMSKQEFREKLQIASGTMTKLNKGQEKQLSLAIVIANGIVSFAVEGFAEKVKEYAPIMKKVDSIPRMLESAAVALKPYEEYLD